MTEAMGEATVDEDECLRIERTGPRQRTSQPAAAVAPVI